MSVPLILLIGFLINLAVALVIVRLIYFSARADRQYIFTFLAFNTTIYFLMSVLTKVELSVGVGFGLFGLFSLLRYRTDPMPPREMTYLFVIIALPVINSILSMNGEWAAMAAANGAVVAVLFVLEQGWAFRVESSMQLTYERIELITPQNYPHLLADLRERTGLPVTRCEIESINFLRDTALIRLYYDPRQLAAATPGATGSHAPSYGVPGRYALANDE